MPSKKWRWSSFQTKKRKMLWMKYAYWQVSGIRIFAHTKRRSLTSRAAVYGKLQFYLLSYSHYHFMFSASSWSTPTMETCFRRSLDIKKSNNTYLKTLSGKYSFRLSADSNHCTIWRSFIEIWRAQIFFWTKMEHQSLEIWMYQRLPKKVYFTRKQEHLTTQAQRYGVTSHTIINLIYGL